jgi:hypothetical protein
LKEGEATVSPELLLRFLRVQNGTDIRGVVLDGVLPKSADVFGAKETK